MSKQLRIWLFVLLSTLLTSTTLPAEGVITMSTTLDDVQDIIWLTIKANGPVSIDGARKGRHDYYTLTSDTITIRGDVTHLSCDRQRLTSLDVSGCTTLRSLDCSWNRLTSLDVSKNTALTTLECYENQLTSLDVSGCTSLTMLNCQLNQLTSLDVSGCTALTELYCSKNQLTSLDFSGCTTLTELYCWDNKLTSLNVSGYTALTTLSCGVNQLTSLNASGCTALTELHCFSDQLTSLDVSGCTSLPKFDCSNKQLTSLNLSGCTALTWLYCDRNQLTSLNVSGCTALTKLDCWDNQLTSLDVSGCTALTTLICSWDQLTSLNASGCTALTKLDCSYNPLTSVNLSGCQSLERFSWTGGRLISLDVSSCTALTTLYCDNNQLTSLNLSDCTALSDLACYGNQIKGEEMTRLVNSLPDRTGTLADHFIVVQEPAPEGNICLKSDVAIAKGKNWNTLKYKSDTRKYVAYEGTNSLKVTLTKEGEGTLTATGAADLNAVLEGTELTIVATPADGYKLTALTANGTNILATKKFVVTENTEIKATFTNKTFAVTLTKEGEGTITATGADNLDAVPEGTELTIEATPAAGYKLTALTANCTDILATKKVVVKGATEVKATFADNTGVETTVTQQVQLYPNPATDYLVVEGVAPASEVTLHSMTGERLYAGRADDRGTLQIDLTPYADGVYLVCVAGETYRVVVRR